MTNNVSNREFALNFLAPWNAHNVDAVLASLPSEFEWQYTVGTEPCGAVYRGHTQLRGALQRLFTTVPNIHYDLFDADRPVSKRSYRKLISPG